MPNFLPAIESTRQGQHTTRSGSQSLLIACGFGGLLFIAVFLILGAMAPNYDPIKDTISALELTSLGMAQRVNFAVFGLLALGFAIGLQNELKPGRGSIAIPLFQTLTGIGVIGDAIFIFEPLHLVCDLVAFNAGLVVLFLFAWRFRSETQWKRWGAYSIVTAILMMAFLSAFGFMNHAGGPAGMMEKLAAITRTVWSVRLAFRLLSGARLGLA